MRDGSYWALSFDNHMDYRQFYKERYKIEFGSDYDIHHIDLNHKNNSIDNLILLPKELHKELHQAIKDIPSQKKQQKKSDKLFSLSLSFEPLI